MDIGVLILLCHALMTSGADIVLNIHTPDSGGYGPFNCPFLLDLSAHMVVFGLPVVGIKEFIFQTKTCNDAGIYLSNSIGMDSSKPFYELVLGGFAGAKSCIGRRNNDLLLPSSWFAAFPTCLQWVNPMDVPVCYEYRPYWISWADGYIQLGRGSVINVNMIAGWTDPNHFEMKSIGIITTWGSSGDWIVYIDDLFSGYYSSCQTTDIKADLTIINVVKLDKSKCASQCAVMAICMGFNYYQEENRCELLSFVNGIASSIQRTAKPSWIFYTKCYRYKDVCLGCHF